MYEITEGAKYQSTKHLDLKEIAAQVRIDLRNAQNRGELPADATFTVRISRYSGGQSMNVMLAGMPDSWIYNQPGQESNYDEGIVRHGGLTDAAYGAMRIMEAILFAYNYDGSDTQSDYFNVRFYGGASIQDERDRALRVAEKERQAARKAARTR